jgi:hypothetical protein
MIELNSLPPTKIEIIFDSNYENSSDSDDSNNSKPYKISGCKFNWIWEI